MAESTINYSVGKKVSSSSTSSVTIATATNTELTHITLTPGTWIVSAWANLSGSSTGYRTLTISGSSGVSTTWMNSGRIIFAPASNGNCRETMTFISSALSESKTIYLNAYQNSGGNITTTIYGISAVRIA